MARPQKDGVDYFPFDVDIFQDKKVKLISAEFGEKGVLLFIRLLCEIYRTGGYYMAWDSDDCLLMSQGVGGGCSPSFIAEVVNRCAVRSLFDKRVLDMFGVLTSAGIQRRYLRIVSNSRDSIPMIKEYWLLDDGDPDDVTAGTLKKLAFKSISRKDNPENRKENPEKRGENPIKESKEKEIKSNNSCRVSERIMNEFSRIKQAAPEDMRQLEEFVKRYGEERVFDAVGRAADRGGRSTAYIGRILQDAPPPGRCGPTHDPSEIEAEMMAEWFADAEEFL